MRGSSGGCFLEVKSVSETAGGERIGVIFLGCAHGESCAGREESEERLLAALGMTAFFVN